MVRSLLSRMANCSSPGRPYMMTPFQPVVSQFPRFNRSLQNQILLPRSRVRTQHSVSSLLCRYMRVFPTSMIARRFVWGGIGCSNPLGCIFGGVTTAYVPFFLNPEAWAHSQCKFRLVTKVFQARVVQIAFSEVGSLKTTH